MKKWHLIPAKNKLAKEWKDSVFCFVPDKKLLIFTAFSFDEKENSLIQK